MLLMMVYDGVFITFMQGSLLSRPVCGDGRSRVMFCGGSSYFDTVDDADDGDDDIEVDITDGDECVWCEGVVGSPIGCGCHK